jgi:hypothetical protein
MAQEQPRSRPEPAEPSRRPGQPKPPESVYGDQWGSSGKQGDGEKGQPDRPEPIRPTRKQT